MKKENALEFRNLNIFALYFQNAFSKNTSGGLLFLFLFFQIKALENDVR